MGFDDFLRHARLTTVSTASGIRLGITLGLFRSDRVAGADAEFTQLKRRITDLIEGRVLAKQGSGR